VVLLFVEIEILLHSTCKSSYILYKALRHRNIKFKFVEYPYVEYIRAGIFSVPALFVDGVLTLLDPIEPQDVENLIEGGIGSDFDVEEGVENFANGVVASQALSTIVLLHKSFAPVLEPELTSILSRARYHKREELVGPIVEEIKRRDREIFAEYFEHIVKSVVYGMIRELYWHGMSLEDVDLNHVKMWLLAKATLGRVGLPTPRPSVPQDVAEAMYSILRERGELYLDKIREEQELLLSDREFQYNR